MMDQFQKEILAGIPDVLPSPREYDTTVNHAPKRKDILTKEEKALALKNALRYFDKKHHATLAPEFAAELETYGRIYMYRFRPGYEMYARPIDAYPAKCRQAAAIMAMIQNNLDPRVAQHHLRRQRRRVPELGPVSAHNAVSGKYDRRADAGNVFGPADGAFPVA